MKLILTFTSLVALSMVLLLSGCATHPKMALVKGQDTVDLSNKSVGLIFIRLSNQYKPGYQPNLWVVSFQRNIYNSTSKKWKYNENSTIEIFDAPYRSEKDGFNEYLLTVGLEPGIYDSVSFHSKYDIPLLLKAETGLYLKTNVEIKPNEVIYLGHIDAVIRERKSDAEVRAGPLLPLIDQAVPGFSTGTYDVTIQDRFDDDIIMFSEEYPGLQKVRIEKAVFPKSTEFVAWPY
jgi:hypothetical protein